MGDSVVWRIKRKRRRKPFNPGILFTVLGLSLLVAVFEQSAQSPMAARLIRTVPEPYSFEECSVPVAKEPITTKLVYPYSVIRGGAHSRDELVAEIKRDPVVARHYSGFDASESWIVRVRDEKRVHVSYRIDDKVYWTARKITLGRGEALISDGQNLARARCGNRVSVDPEGPTSPDEPAPGVFETPNVVTNTDLLVSTTVPEQQMPLFEEFRTPLIFNPPDTITLEDTFFTEVFPPFNPPYYFTPPVFFVEPELPEVPEPSTLVLLASALAAYFLLRRCGFWRRASAEKPGVTATGPPQL